eukprot:4767356-Amphidinium_carterae.1
MKSRLIAAFVVLDVGVVVAAMRLRLTLQIVLAPEVQIYESVIDLREKRLDMEDALQDAADALY